MHNSIDTVLEVYEKHQDLPFYRLYHGDKPTGQMVDQSSEESTHAQSMEQLRRILTISGPGRYCVQLKPKLNSSKEVITIHMNLPYTTGQAPMPTQSIGALGAVGNDYIHKSQVEQIIEAKVGALKAENEMAIYRMQMENKFAELEKKLTERKPKEDSIDKFLASPLAQAIAGLMIQKYTGQQPAMAGSNQVHSPTTEIVTDMQYIELNNGQKLTHAIESLKNQLGSEDEAIMLICKVAQWSEENKNNPIRNVLFGELNKVDLKFN